MYSQTSLIYIRLTRNRPQYYRQYIKEAPSQIPESTKRCKPVENNNEANGQDLENESTDDDDIMDIDLSNIDESDAANSEQSDCENFVWNPEAQFDDFCSQAPSFSANDSAPDLDLASDSYTILEAIKLFVTKAKISLRSVKHLVKLLNLVKDLSQSNQNFELPSARSITEPNNIALKDSKQLCPEDGSVLKDSFCNVCNKNANSPDFVAIGNIEQQMRSLLLDKSFMDHINSYKQTQHYLNRGKVYTEFMQKSPPNTITFCLNSDGFQINNTSKIEPWPIYLIINELDYNLRFSMRYVILVCIYYGKRHPNLSKLLEISLSNQMDIFKRGIIVNNEIYNLAIIFASLDKPARASLMEMNLHSSILGCMYCFTELVTVKIDNRTYKTFPIKDARQLEREDDDFSATAITSELTSRTQYGQKATPFLENFTSFKPISGQIIDLMHCVHGGSVKKICYLLFHYDNRNMPFSVYKHIDKIDKLILQLRPPTVFIQRLRSLKFMNYFRAHEYRSFILYYGPIVLRQFISENQYQNLVELSQICFLSSLSFFDEQTIAVLENKIEKFLDGFSKIYGSHYVSINLHEMIHIPKNIRNNGAIFNWSCYGFENFNKILKQTVHGSQKSHLEMIKRFNMLISSIRGFNHRDECPISAYICELLSGCKLPKKSISSINGFKVIFSCLSYIMLRDCTRRKVSASLYFSNFIC